MPLRPAQARWFETYLPRDQTVRGVEVLARTGAVELETARRQVQPADAGRLRDSVDRFQHQAGAHAQDLPRTGAWPSALRGDPLRLAEQALQRLRAWCDRVDLVHARLDHLEAEEHYLLLLRECLEAMARDGLDLERVISRTRFLCKCLFACPPRPPRQRAPWMAWNTWRGGKAGTSTMWPASPIAATSSASWRWSGAANRSPCPPG